MFQRGVRRLAVLRPHLRAADSSDRDRLLHGIAAERLAQFLVEDSSMKVVMPFICAAIASAQAITSGGLDRRDETFDLAFHFICLAREIL